MGDRKAAPAWLGWSVDGLPAVLFLIVLLIARDFRLATWCLVGASALALIVNYAVERRIRPLPAISGALALVFGGASLLLNRPDILQMKMTIVDGLLGAALFGGLLMGKNPLKMMLGASFNLTERAWTILAIRYGLFWWACAAANEVVRRTQTAQTWATFRVAVIVLAVIFALAQTPFLLKHNRPPGLAPDAPPPDPGF